jgi:O-antigen/teichoic acid export membrane protein
MIRLRGCRRLVRRIAEAANSNRRLLTNAGSMVGTTAVTSLLGVAFWFVAAHHFSQKAVGIASASVAAMTLLGFTATLGMGTLLMGELPRREDGHRSLLNAALAVAALTGFVFGLAFALLAPLMSSNLGAVGESWFSTVFFAAGVGLTALALVLDQALIGLLRGGLQLGRNAIFALVKLLALVAIAVLVANAGAPWIYSAWAGGIALSLFVLVRFYARRSGDSLRPNFALLRSLRASAASHAAVNLGLETADLAMPILVLAIVSATAAASFYMAWMITNLLVMVPLALSMVLYAIGSGNDHRLTARFRFSLGVSLAFGLIANLVLIPAASPILGVFGHTYSDQAAMPLHILALGTLPLAFKTHYVALRRVQRRLGTALPVVWGGTLLELGGGAIGASLGGLLGLACGWLAGLCVEALVMGGDVVRVIRPPRQEPPATQAQSQRERESVAGFGAAAFERL